MPHRCTMPYAGTRWPFATRALLAGALLSAGPAALADNYEWFATNSNWDVSTNWINNSNIFEPAFDDGTVPDGFDDTAVITIVPETTLVTNRELGDLVVASGGILDLDASMAVAAGTGTTGGVLVTDAGSELDVFGSLSAEFLTLSVGGTLDLSGGTVQVTTQGIFNPGTFVTGLGVIDYVGAGNLRNEGTIRSDFAGTITFRRTSGVGTFDWDGLTETTAVLDVQSGTTLSVELPTTDDFSGQINLNGGTFNVTHNWGKDGFNTIEMNGDNHITGASFILGGSAPMNVNGGNNTISSTTFSAGGASSINVDVGASLTIDSPLATLGGGVSYTIDGSLNLRSDNLLGGTIITDATINGAGTVGVEVGTTTLMGNNIIAPTLQVDSTLELGPGGTLLAGGPIFVNGGTINAKGNDLDLVAGEKLIATAGGQVNFANYHLIDAVAYEFYDGSSMSLTNALDVVGGELIVDGPGTTVDTNLNNSSANIFGGGIDPRVTVRNHAAYRINNTAELRIGGGSNAILDIESGGDFIAGTIWVGSHPSGAGTINLIGVGSTLMQLGSADLTVGSGGGGALSTGAVNITDGAALTTGTGTTTINFNGTINLDTAATLSATTIDHTHGGTFNFLDGTLSVDTFLGTLEQFNGGTLAPGNSPGTTTITGDYLLDFGQIEIELAGTSPGTQHDQVIVGGELVIGAVSQLDVKTLFGFDASQGDVFDILDFGSLTGTFDSVLLPGLSGVQVWDQSQLYSHGVLQVVSSVAGDLDGDGQVSQADLNLVLNNFGVGSDIARVALGDTNLDGTTGVADLNLVLRNWTGTTPPVFEVPEPGSLALLGLALPALMRRRRVG